MASVTASKVLALAQGELSVKASDIKRCKYNKWYYGADVSGSEYDWCVVFLQWLFHMMNAEELLYIKTANVGYQALEFSKRDKLYKSGFKAGDLVIFSWSGRKSTWISGVKTLDHIGIIEKVNKDGTYTTIEGNTGSTSNGEVKRQIRYKNQISCVLRPDYKKEKTIQFKKYRIKMQKLWQDSKYNTKEQVAALQTLLSAKGYKGENSQKLSVDGVFGDNTKYALKAFQKKNNLKVDGICHRVDWSALLNEYKT